MSVVMSGALARAVMTLALFILMASFTAVEAKTPGKTYCFNGVCHRVMTLAETTARVGKVDLVSASHYDHCGADRFNPCGLTSSGETFRADAPDNAASPHLPNGTIILVRNPSTRKSVVLRVNNAGPYYGKRTLDVSKGAADALGFRKRGVARLEVSILKAPTTAEATYRRNRTYPKVPGYLGEFATAYAARQQYASITQTRPANTQVAAIYPQSKSEGDPRPKRASTAGNGIEQKWLAQRILFAPPLSERKQIKAAAARFAQSIRIASAR